MGVMYLTSPIMMGFCQKLGRWARWTPLLGLITMALSLSLSSFSTTTTHLIVSQGVFYGVGGGIAYCPCIVVSLFMASIISYAPEVRPIRQTPASFR